MFAGHAAVAAIIGSSRPRVPFLPLLLAAYAPDAVEIMLHGFALSHGSAMQWSHSITAMVAGAVLLGLGTFAVTRRDDVAWLTAAAYMSHWACDLLTGENKPTWLGGPSVGLALYQVPVADFLVEGLLVVAAALLVRRRRPGASRRIALAAAVLLMLQLGFNLGDRARLHGLKRNLVRATGAALAPVSPSPRPGHS